MRSLFAPPALPNDEATRLRLHLPVVIGAVALAILLADAPLATLVPAQAAAVPAELAAPPALPEFTLPGPRDHSPGTRHEADGSLTILGAIEDDPGPMQRAVAPLVTVVSQVIQQETGQQLIVGVFTRTWSHDGRTITTTGGFVTTQGQTYNVNVAAVEGAPGLDATIIDVVQRDGLPILLNTLPFIQNYVHPSSLVLFIAFAAGASGLVTAAQAAAALGYPDLALTFLNAIAFTAFSPLYNLRSGYPYHTDPNDGEVYRTDPDAYVWTVVRRSAGVSLWTGSYLLRAGGYVERVESRPDGTHYLADAWKRVAAGPAHRVDAATIRGPGVYLRQDIHRDFVVQPSGRQLFDADNRLTSGPYHDATGEGPGATVHMEDHQHGAETVFYPESQQTRIAIGATVAGQFQPMVGTETVSRHRRYVDITNLGAPVPSIESYRVTSYGFYADTTYVPVAGFDYWGERQPMDLWALLFATGPGLGDQTLGDAMVRVGAFNAAGRFVPVAGTRLDDDFPKHRYAYRTMASAGLFQADPLDPGPPVPGQAPDGAVFRPLAAATYDGVQPLTPWVTANAGNNPGGMGTWLASAGALGGSSYAPLVGVEYLPQSLQNQRAARETYRVGVFPADYATFVPVAGITYDGRDTTAAFAQRLVVGHQGQNPREGEADVSGGAYAPGRYLPVVGVNYRPEGVPTHPYGHKAAVGVFNPVTGDYTRLASAQVAFQDGPPATWGTDVEPCKVFVRVILEPNGFGPGVSPTCLP